MLSREKLVQKVLTYQNQNVIKIVSGVRRSGKSTLFDLIIEEFHSQVKEEINIIRYNFEDPIHVNLLQWNQFYDDLLPKIDSDRMNYVFLDEIQEVENFEKALNGLMLQKRVDIYVTGSNAYFLSGELATKLTGRYVETHILPLSFSEYYAAFAQLEKGAMFQRYMTQGAFPQLVAFQKAKIMVNNDYLQGLYSTVLIKDVLQRLGTTDDLKLKDITNFLFDSIGSMVSYSSIANTLTSYGRKITNHTVENYISALCDAFLFYKVDRYDLKGKRILSSGSKFYCVDVGLRAFAIGKAANIDLGHILENLVFLELKRRHKQVWVGKINDLEIDFVVETHDGDLEYYQVAYSVRNEETLQRELRSLKAIKDYHRRFLITMDNDPIASYDGIEKRYAVDWFLDV
jgi:predicted AAA+ superfamily ATPase